MQPWQILTPQDLEQIHQTTLRILGEVGIILDDPDTRHILLEAGAAIRNERVVFPPEMVEGILEKCGGTVRVRGRGGVTAEIGSDTLHWHNLGGARDVFDPDSKQTRRATVQDVREATRLLDALEHATTVTPFYTPTDVPGELMSLAMYRHALPHTTKPLQGPGVQTPEEVKYAVAMAEVIGPVDEVLTMSVSPVSPLTIPDEMAGSMVEIARHGIPFGPLPCPTAGTTAPFSLAGALTQQNAEVLASVVIVQCVTPGLPIIYCGRLAMMEPRTGSSVWGGVEMGMASAATVQIGHFYGFPVNVYGLSTNAHTLDVQNGYERALNTILPALAGADELSGIGEMAAGVMGSLAQMVVDNDIASSVKRALRGFKVDEHALAFEVIASVMDGSHNFLAEKHTIDFLRSGEINFTKLSVRNSFDEWVRGGSQGILENAQKKAQEILTQHEVPPLADEQEQELDNILAAAERELVSQS
ncbi:MAG TPA: trimethylamine methyltransferase family protein [Anaerolineales bacterium]|nr:trimethylamine methyltransferase family protein [Anaerolineales bacterium]